MKKVLALVLTAAMLVSCMIVGLSAARLVTENKTDNGFWQFPAGNSYNPVNVGAQGENFDVELNIRIDDAAGGLKGWGDLAKGPVFKTTAAGIDGGEIAGTYEVGKWYSLKLDAEAGKTTVYVNGENLGTVDGTCTLYDGTQAFWTWDKISIDNLRVGTFYDDMEGAGIGGQGMKVLESNVTYANENVSISKDKAWFASGQNWNDGVQSETTTSFKTEIKIMGSSEHKSPSLKGCMNNAPYIDFANDKVGFESFWITGDGCRSLAYDFALDTWYTVVYEAADGATSITINGEKVGEIPSGDYNLQPSVNQNFNGVYVADFKITDTATGDVLFHEDFEDGTYDGEAPTGGSAVEFEEKIAAHDLGLAFWQFPAGNSYNPVNVGAQGDNFDVELDICIDDAAGTLKGWGDLAKGPVFSTTAVGIDGATIAGTYKVGEWYHLKLDAEGGKTTVYVDDQLVGTVNGTCTLYDGTQAFWTWDKISIDNLKVGTFFDDMEGAGIGGQGNRVEYEIKKRTIFDFVTTSTPEGQAYMVKADYIAPGGDDANVYFDHEGMSPRSDNFIMNFDLALLPTKDATDGTWLELWTNTASRRFKVGTKYTGRDTDLTAFDWGEATINNFHNVTFEMDAAHQKARIYVDKELVYEGASGQPWTDRYLGMVWNGTAIIDNYTVYTLDGEKVDVDPAHEVNFDQWYSIDLNAEDFCATNGHIPGITTRTTQQTCYSEGEDTTVCAVCAQTAETHVVPMNAHNWASYDINRKTDDGLVYTNCKNDGCTEVRYTSLPAADTYTGTLHEYYDMSDDMVLVIDNSWNGDTWTVADGYAKYGESTNNYGLFYPKGGTVAANNFSWNIDLVYNGTFVTSDADRHEDGKPGYGHTLYFWFGGTSTTAVMAGYNADEHKLFIISGTAGANQDNPFPTGTFAAQTCDFTMVEGEAYNIQLSVSYDDKVTASAAIWVNGTKMVEYSNVQDRRARVNIKYADDVTTLEYIILRDFGVNIDIDAMAFGTADFGYTNRVYNGDVDGDYAITSSDALMMRKYLARVFKDADITVSRADANGDSAINAKDQLVIRKALMA